jgi:hypothetical protein
MKRYFGLLLALSACGQVDSQTAQTAPPPTHSGDLCKAPCNPPPPPPTIVLSGYNSLPSGGSATYSLTTDPGGTLQSGVRWTILSGGGSLSSSTTNPVTYTAPIVSSTTSVGLQATSSTGKNYSMSITVVLPVVGYPQGLTGGVSYINHECSLSLGGLLAVIGGGLSCAAAFSTINWWILPACGGALLGAVGSGVSAESCDPPTEYVTGHVNGFRTLVIDPNGQSFWTLAAPGWLAREEGDLGNNSGYGFYHQELTAPSYGVGGNGLTTGPTDLFKLPYGTDCGFHHNQNSPANLQTGVGTCMGYDAYVSCPTGWQRKTMYDANSSGGYFVWCEYEDPHEICIADPSCLQTAHNMGLACGLGSDTTDGQPGLCGELGQNICPSGWVPSGYFDDGRSSGQGLMVCLPM